MKKIISLILCVLMVFSLTACKSSYKGELYKDNNDNYKSSDVDSNGNPIFSGDKSTESNDFILSEIPSSETSEPIHLDDELIVHFIDCGNADATFIELPGNKTMLIDAGNNEDGQDIVSYILNKNCTKIDFLVGTHPHEDHIGGLDDIINTFNIGNIYMPRIPSEYVPTTKTYESVLTAISEKGLTITSPSGRQIIYNENDCTVEFLNSSNNVKSNDMNEYSLVIKITYYNNTFIFTADGEESVEKAIMNDYSGYELECDVLKVGHHGSYTSTSERWLELLKPSYAFIPCGTNNEYGHPHHEVISRLELRNVTYYRADIDGTVIMTSDGQNIGIKTKCTGNIPLGNDGWDKSMIQ